MLKKITVVAAALAAMGVASSAIAAGPGAPGSGEYTVDVNIDVLPVVSMWANDDSITLTMDGADGNNSATAESSLSIINNVEANITAEVDGTLPAPIVPGGGINFFIFNGGDAASAVAAITANAYAPAGALAWNFGTLGTSQTLIPNTGVNTSIENTPIVYASAAPGEIPLPDSYDLTVLYTITAN
jgi:hypothetical protein